MFKGIFSLKYLLIEFVIPNLSQIYFCIPEIFKKHVSNRFLSTRLPSEFVFSFIESMNSQWVFCSQKAGVKCSY